MKIVDIKSELSEIVKMPVEAYFQRKVHLQEFIKKYEADDRAGVVKICQSAEKIIAEIDAELIRLEGMYFYERENRNKYPVICGVDEVGRGPFAGPIVTAAVILPNDICIPYLNDSKKLSHQKREEIYDLIMEKAVSVSFGIHSEKTIDEIGVGKADSDAMKNAVLGLSQPPDLVLVDAFPIPGLSMKQIPIIKGDAKSASIAAASIVAKVKRDRFMVEMDEKYPGYGFAKNKGYGSKDHIEALKKMGPCEIHRKSFIHNYI